MTDILMPALSPTMEEGTLSKWNIKVGDTVSSGQVIAEIETDKATMEVEAVDEGEVVEILVEEGAEGVKVNAVIARLKGEGEEAASSGASASSAPPQSAASTATPRAGEQGGGDATPKGEHGSPGATATPEGVKPTAQALASDSKAGGASSSKPQAKADGERVFASPLARRMAEQAGLDLKSVKGTGPRGRIVKSDVEATEKGGGAKAQQQPSTQQPQSAAASASPPAQVRSLEQMGIQPGSYELIPLDNIRKVSARRLTEAFRDIPHFPLTIDVELNALLAARERINKALESRGVKVSVNDIVIKAVAQALQAVPEANASFTPEGIAVHKNADIAMAVAITGGLITPVIRAAQTKSLSQIATETKDLAKRARDKKLKPDEFQGGTFTVSNLGMFGIKSFSSIINEPGGCIMSVGAGIEQPVARNGQLAVATVMSVTLTCDHRVVDGATGARFLQAFKPMIEDPAVMLA